MSALGQNHQLPHRNSNGRFHLNQQTSGYALNVQGRRTAPRGLPRWSLQRGGAVRAAIKHSTWPGPAPLARATGGLWPPENCPLSKTRRSGRPRLCSAGELPGPCCKTTVSRRS